MNRSKHLCLQTQYGNPLIYVTENGVSEKVQRAQLCDEWRIEYLKGYINEMLKGNFKSILMYKLFELFSHNNSFYFCNLHHKY